jgi:hypothetical protein
MNDILAQLGWLAQRSDFEGWANILFVVVMAILWLVGALVKTMSKKGPQPQQEGAAKEQRRPGESWHQRLARKAQEMQRRIEEEAGLREPDERPRPVRKTPARPPQPPAGKIRVRSGRGGESVIVYEGPQPPSSMEREHQAARQRQAQEAITTAGQFATKDASAIEARIEPKPPEMEPVIWGMPGVTAEQPMPLEPGKGQLSALGEPATFEPAAIIDCSDPDTMKKAILHYEILGKPLALRDPAGQTPVF